ncbi:hypothetical protein C8Q76DRAFT_797959 [Earliella scabrosa]|nr:hypothetical protein C8Q76DRAFT_797959 [Earliella scabrosa]
MAKLEGQARVWSPASHGMWAVWGVVQAREFVEGMDGEPEFDYLGYAVCRMDAFRRELRALGIPGLPVPAAVGSRFFKLYLPPPILSQPLSSLHA